MADWVVQPEMRKELRKKVSIRMVDGLAIGKEGYRIKKGSMEGEKNW